MKPAAKVGEKEREHDDGTRSPSPRPRDPSRRQSPSPAAELAAAPSPASEAAAAPEDPAALAHRKRRRRKRTAEEKEVKRRRCDAGSPAEDEVAASPEEQAPADAADASTEGGDASPDIRRQQVGVVEESAEEKLFAAVSEAVGAHREREPEPKVVSGRGARRRKHPKNEGAEEAERSRAESNAETAEGKVDEAKRGRHDEAGEEEPAHESPDRSEAAASDGCAKPKELPEKHRSKKSRAEDRERKPKKEKKHKEHKKKAKGPNQNGEGGKQQESDAAVAHFRAMIRDIYKRKNSAKLGDVDELLAKYAGAEEELYDSICEKYGEEPKRAGAAAPPRAQPPGFAAAARGFARKASAPPPPPPALAPALAHNGEAPQEGGWPFVEEFSVNSEESDCSSELSCAQARWSAAGAASRAVGPPPANLYDDLALAPGPRARVRVAKTTTEHVATGFGAGIFGAEAPPPPPPPKRPPGTFAALADQGAIELPTFLGLWRDTMGNEVQVDWARPGSRGGQLDVILSKPRGGREPIKLCVKAKGSGRFACGHYDLDTQKSTVDRIIWLDSRNKGKDSVWERPGSGHPP